MDPWLLGGGAALLVGIALWIVWPTAGASAPEENLDMTGNPLPPQGDAFEDQYTSATADLSAGAVAVTREGQSTPSAGSDASISAGQSPSSMAGAAGVSAVAPSGVVPPPTTNAAPSATPNWSSASSGSMQPDFQSQQQQGMFGLGMGAGGMIGGALALGGVAAGAWWFRHWQQERNKPINRLRRSATRLSSHLPIDRLPIDPDDLPEYTAPLGGAAFTSFIAGWALGRSTRPSSPSVPSSVSDVRDRVSGLDLAALAKLIEHLPSAGDGRQAPQKALERVRGRAADLQPSELGRRASRWAGRSSETPGAQLARRANRWSNRAADWSSRAAEMQTDQPRGRRGLRFGALAIAAAAGYFIWRKVRGTSTPPANYQSLGGE